MPFRFGQLVIKRGPSAWFVHASDHHADAPAPVCVAVKLNQLAGMICRTYGVRHQIIQRANSIIGYRPKSNVGAGINHQHIPSKARSDFERVETAVAR
jgi:hypothetical protein